MTIRKTTSGKSAALAVATDASPASPAGRAHRPHVQHYAHHNVVVVASPSRRATLLQRQVARALDAIDMDDVVASLDAHGTATTSDAPLYGSPAPSTSGLALGLHKTPPPPPAASLAAAGVASPTAGFQISPNAVKRKRSHSVASSVSSSSTSSAAATDAALLDAASSPPVVHSELRVDIDAVDKTSNRVVVAKRAIKGGVTPSKRCKDKKKKLKVDVIERALKRFRAELRTSDGSAGEGLGESCYEFTSVCHRDDDGDAGLTTPRHASHGESYMAELIANTKSSNRPIERGSSRRDEGVAQTMRVQVGVAAAQGARAYMEDRFSVTARLFEHHEQRDELQSPASLLAVYDGHNGAIAAEYGARRFRELLSDSELLLDLCKRPVHMTLSDHDIERVEEVLKDTFEVVDDEIVELTISEGKRDGSTVLLGLLIGGKMFVANLGDTRGVLGTIGDGDGDGTDDVVRVSVDHKPDLKAETERIEEAGGKVIFSGCWRVAHDEVPLRLAVSRSLGDHPLKANLPLSCSAPLVSVVPDIQVLDVSGSGDDVLVFATDGLWDRLSDDDAIRIARTKIAEYNNTCATPSAASHAARNAMQSAAIALVETALVKRSMDNITAMVIGFSSESTPRLDDVEIGEPLDLELETMNEL